MKKISLFLLFAVIILTTLSATAQTTVTASFAGNWTLDKAKTKNVPKEVNGLKLEIVQDDKQISIKSTLDGEVLMPTPQRSGLPRPGGEGGQADANAPSAPNFNGRMALRMGANESTYTLDGKETSVDIKQNEQTVGTATLKSKWDKDGKGLQLTSVRKIKRENANVTVTVKEKWELSPDGKTLKIKRTAELPAGNDQIELVFVKDSVE